MTDLTHWDAVIDFNAEQVAALVVGLDPDELGYSPIKGRHTYERMKACYTDKKRWLLEDHDDGVQKDEFFTTESPCMLTSSEMEYWLRVWSYDQGRGLEQWLKDESKSGFEAQRFARKEIIQWLSAVGVQSQYSFGVVQGEEKPSVERPLGTTERNTLLSIIAALCKEAKIPYEKSSKAAGMIQSTAATMGVSIGETTIEGHLKKIPDALATRMK